MPLANTDEQPPARTPPTTTRRSTRWSPTSARSATGPRIPEVDLGAGDLAEGGELYRANCRRATAPAGIGGALSYGRAAPRAARRRRHCRSAAAVRVGPGQMPVFGPETVSDERARTTSSATSSTSTIPRTPAALPLGRAGPIPEGFVAWLVGMVALLALAAWIGTRSPIGRSAGVSEHPVSEDARAQRGAPSGARSASLRAWPRWPAIGAGRRVLEGGQPQAEGVLLAVASAASASGIVLWAKHFMPDDEVAEERRPLASTEEEVAAFTADFEAGEPSLRSRRAAARHRWRRLRGARRRRCCSRSARSGPARAGA